MSAIVRLHDLHTGNSGLFSAVESEQSVSMAILTFSRDSWHLLIKTPN